MATVSSSLAIVIDFMRRFERIFHCTATPTCKSSPSRLHRPDTAGQRTTREDKIHVADDLQTKVTGLYWPEKLLQLAVPVDDRDFSITCIAVDLSPCGLKGCRSSAIRSF